MEYSSVLELTMDNPGLEHIAFCVFQNLDMKSLITSRKISVKWKNFIDNLIACKKSLLVRLIREAQEFVVAKAAKQFNSNNGTRHLKDHLQLYKKWSYVFNEQKTKLPLKELKLAWDMLKESCSAERIQSDPFLYVFGGENEDFIRLLSENFEKDKTESEYFERKLCNYFDPQSLFFHACKHGLATTVKNLLNSSTERGIDVNAIDQYWHPYYDEIDNATSIYYTDGLGFSENVWHMASSNVNSEVLEELLKNNNMPKTYINAANVFGQTPLQYSCKYGRERNVELLLKNKDFPISIHHRDRESKTALHFAAVKGNKEIVKLLLELPGIEANPGDINGETPLHLACRKSISYHPHPEYPVGGWYDIVLLYCTMKKIGLIDFDFNARDKYDASALHNAVAFDHPEITELLLNQNGVDKAPVDKFGATPLSIAQKKEQEDIIALFNTKE